MYSVDMSEYTPDLVDDDSGLFPDEATTHDFQSAMFTLIPYPQCTAIRFHRLPTNRAFSLT